MSPKNKFGAKGVITFHTPINRDLFISEISTADLQNNRASIRSYSQPSAKSSPSRRNQRSGSSEVHNPPSRTSHTLSQDRSIHTSIRRLQKRMERDKQQISQTMHDSLNTENSFIKELEMFLNHHDLVERRRKELLHKDWTEHLWLPLQKNLNQRVSSCSIDIKRRQSLYSHFLQHCNSKGYVFLDTYNQKEYDPFLCHLKPEPHNHKCAEIKARPKDAWTAESFEMDSKMSSRQEDKLSQHFHTSLVLSSSVGSLYRSNQQTPSSSPASTSTPFTTKTPTENSGKIKHSRSDNILCCTDPKNARLHRPNYLFSA